MELKLMLIFINYLIAVGGEYNEQEENMLTDFLSYLKIKKCIFIGDRIRPSMLKKLSASNIYTGITLEQFDPLDVIIGQRTTTGILHKTTVNFPEIKDHFSFLQEKEKLHIASKLIWLLIANGSDINHSDFFIPYDCEFYIIYPSGDSSGFEITKNYNLGNNYIQKHLGTWYRNGSYDFSAIRRFLPKMDANQTSLRTIGYCANVLDLTSLDLNYVYYVCSEEDFVKDLLRIMNFHLVETIPKDDYNYLDFDILVTKIIAFNEMSYLKYVKYWPKGRLDLYIKYPTTKMSDDYFYRPFGTDVWVTLIFTVIGGGLFCLLIKYLNNLCVEKLRTHNVLNYVLLPFDSVCYQGEDQDYAISIRVCGFIFRIFGIFTIQAFSTDLASYLSSQILNLPFHNLEEFAKNRKYRLLITNKSHNFMYGYFEERNDTLGQQVRSGLITYFKYIEEMNEKLCSNEKFAFPYHNGVFPNIDCSIVRIPELLTTYLHVFKCGNENYYTDIINHVFLKAWEFGLTQRLIREQNENSIERYLQREETQLHPVEINQLTKIFCILWFGCIIAWILYLCELVTKFITGKFNKKKRENRQQCLK